MGTVDINDGTFHRFDQSNTEWRDMAKAAFSSASIPTVFPPYSWKGKGLFVDGSLAMNVNVEDAIKQCRELVDDDSKITVDILLCKGAKHISEVESSSHKAIDNYHRHQSIHKRYHGGNVIRFAEIAHPEVNFRYVIGQQDGYTSTDMLNFNGKHTWKLQQKGREQA